MTGRRISAAVIATDGVGIFGEFLIVAGEEGAAGGFAGASEPIDGRHFIGVGSEMRKIDFNYSLPVACLGGQNDSSGLPTVKKKLHRPRMHTHEDEGVVCFVDCQPLGNFTTRLTGVPPWLHYQGRPSARPKPPKVSSYDSHPQLSMRSSQGLP